MIYSDKYKFIFIAIPKTGTCTIEALLKKIMPNDIKCFGSNIKKKNGLHKHITAKELRKILTTRFKNYTTFAFVRNPYDRVVSWYTYTYRLNEKDCPDLMKNDIFKQRSSYGMTFEDFLINKKAIWASQKQCNYVADNNKIIVDIILKFENFELEIMKIMKSFGITITNDMIGKKNTSQYRKKLGGDYHNFCNNDHIKSIIYEECKDDFILFNYPK